MKYQITVIPSTTPLFEFRFEWAARRVAKIISDLKPFSSINIWEFDESINQIPLNAAGIPQNPTKLIGCHYFGKYQDIDWRKRDV